MTALTVQYPPAEIRRQAVQMLIESGKEPSPAELLKQSKAKSHPAYDFFWKTPEKVWAHVGRYEGARRILQITKTELVVGEKTIDVRMVEYVRNDNGGQWASIMDIVQDAQLRKGYMAETRSLLEAAIEKIKRIEEIEAKSGGA